MYGEDPYLSARLGLEMTKGIQENGVVATAKHSTCLYFLPAFITSYYHGSNCLYIQHFIFFYRLL
ncbi:MAG TPA: glycoside hydrolase family 3 N-terminal domain-containing protein [Niabella sp.]|nr:glycoside hydrolase family 3 N-terminal domain-containing protein [Niabella sp.]HOZ95434.1 glycoside hydrolase family 3 N-terminal domain-containing protein [Niabella sp.]HQW14324.1 glycoside hydrolase family 3 N-terminal domain-containing protein [Niabella sp.]HQX18397.1 glycoside hydrolase family 3 N-terminal domain-containing protein [Niabella sp.]HQX40111.1 glycoside hydrolase family 3 N-terminal domain-containing protein [Niabella sp.]